MNYARLLRTILHGTAVVFVAAAAFSSPPAGADTKGLSREEAAIVEHTRAIGDNVINCITERIYDASIDETDPHREKFAKIGSLSEATKATLFEQVAKDYPEIRDLGPDGLGDYCENTLFRKFRHAFLEVYPVWAEKDTDVLAKLGLENFSHLAPFIDAFNNNFGAHTYGHTEITGDALLLLAGFLETDYGIELSDDALWLIRSGVLATDFYGWDEEAYHAHTPDHRCCDESVRSAAVKEGRERFVALFKRHWNGVLNAADETHAAFQMGILAHMIQDMVYHRGITLLQHAGLSYHVKEDPDLPPGSDKFPVFEPGTPAARIYNTAVLATKRMLKSLITKMAEKDRTALEYALTWTGRDNIDIDNVAVASFTVGLFPSEKDEDGNEKKIPELAEIKLAFSMMSYYARASIYALNKRDPKVELVPETDSNKFGLVSWPIKDVQDDLHD